MWRLKKFIHNKFKTEGIIKTRFSRNIYLDYSLLDSLKLNKEEVENAIKDFLLFEVPEIADVYTRSELEKLTATRNSTNYLLNGFNKKRSGDILYSLKSNYLNYEHKYGSNHGSRHSYDNHIPLIFYGSNISKSSSSEEVYIVDIAATICNLLGITPPTNSIGKPLIEN